MKIINILACIRSLMTGNISASPVSASPKGLYAYESAAHDLILDDIAYYKPLLRSARLGALVDTILSRKTPDNLQLVNNALTSVLGLAQLIDIGYDIDRNNIRQAAKCQSLASMAKLIDNMLLDIITD